jgi:NADP-dependent aldehyde dehydrogenase
MLEPIGPVAVFGASNFPLAFSIAGGDTASALAARNPVIAKAHPAHPGTSELVADAIVRAVKSKGLPEGTFSMLHGLGTEVSISLVRHPKLRALAFTGSQRAGRALFDAAAARPNPIPVFAEMGSVNPVFLLPEALATNPRGIADGTARSVMLGVGQFCTCPGLIFAQDGAGFDDFVQRLTEIFKQAAPGSMLNPAIRKGYVEKLESASKVQGVQRYEATKNGDVDRTEGQPVLLVTDAPTWLKNHVLHEEIFGPATLVIRCTGAEEVVQCSRELEGTLTATIHAEPGELASHSDLVDTLSRKAGRLVFNGFPTGVEVGHAMHHGGPYPATTDEKFTSVGSSAIYRFARPICFQNFPDAALPPELQNANPRNIWRLIDGRLTKDAL